MLELWTVCLQSIPKLDRVSAIRGNNERLLSSVIFSFHMAELLQLASGLNSSQPYGISVFLAF